MRTEGICELHGYQPVELTHICCLAHTDTCAMLQITTRDRFASPYIARMVAGGYGECMDK
jgi:hypothetical protein